MPKNICPDCGSDSCKTLGVLSEKYGKGLSLIYMTHIIIPKSYHPIDISFPKIKPPELKRNPYDKIKALIILLWGFTGVKISDEITRLGDIENIKKLHNVDVPASYLYEFVVLFIVISIFFAVFSRITRKKEKEIVDGNKKLNAEYEEKLSKLWKCSSCGNIYDPN